MFKLIRSTKLKKFLYRHGKLINNKRTSLPINGRRTGISM